jgi:tripartite-type tricarboxylate transporter receptor subunit TctC
VQFTPWGSTDIRARAIGQKLQEVWGQPFVVENRPGAGGSIGATEVARAAPDGYTLLMGHIGTLAVNPTLCPSLSYDPRASFAPVALVAHVPNVLVVNPAVPTRSAQELIALAKAKPGSVRCASGGNGSAAHIAMEYFKLRALAVSGLQPVESPPELPTIASVIPDFEAIQWYGIVAPARTPAAVSAMLNEEINKVLVTPALKSRLEAEGAAAAPTSPDAFGTMIAREIARWKPVIEQAQMKPE